MIRLRDPDNDEVREVCKQLLSNVKIAGVARAIGKSRGTLYKWQRGESMPTFAEMCALVHALGEHLRIDMGPDEEAEEEQDVLTILARVLANQERQIRMLRQAIGGS